MRLAVLVVIAAAVLACQGCQRNTGTSGQSSPTAKYVPPKQYTQLTREIIAQLPDEELSWAVHSYILYKLGDDYSREREVVKSKSTGMQMVYSTCNLEGEVFNGGFLQYFFNTEGMFVLEAVDGYRMIGAKEHAALVAKAIDLAAKERVLRADVRASGEMQKFADSYKQTKLASLDDVFYELDNSENATDLRAKYIRAHPDQFEGD